MFPPSNTGDLPFYLYFLHIPPLFPTISTDIAGARLPGRPIVGVLAFHFYWVWARWVPMGSWREFVFAFFFFFFLVAHSMLKGGEGGCLCSPRVPFSTFVASSFVLFFSSSYLGVFSIP